MINNASLREKKKKKKSTLWSLWLSVPLTTLHLSLWNEVKTLFWAIGHWFMCRKRWKLLESKNACNCLISKWDLSVSHPLPWFLQQNEIKQNLSRAFSEYGEQKKNLAWNIRVGGGGVGGKTNDGSLYINWANKLMQSACVQCYESE